MSSPGFPSSSSSAGGQADNGPVGTQYAQEAEIVNGTISPTDEDAQYTNLGPDEAITTDYLIESRYENDRQVFMAGLTSPTPFDGQSVAFFQLASPTLLWVVDWTAARFLQVPNIPDPASVPDDWLLLDVHVEPAMLVLAPGGAVPLYRISGTYFYGSKNPKASVFSQVAFPIPPWMNDVFSRTIPITALQGGLATTKAGAGTSSSPGSAGTTA